MVNIAPVLSVRFAAVIVPPMASTKPRADGKPQAGPRPHLVALLHAEEFLENVRQVGRRNALSFVDDLQRHGGGVPPAADVNGRAGSGVFCCVVEQVEQRLLEQHRINIEHRQVGREAHLDAVVGEDLARALKRAPDDFAHIMQSGVRYDRARFEPRHIEQIGDEPIEPVRLVDDGGEQVGLLRIRERIGEIAQRAGRAEHRRERRLEIVRDRGQQRRAQMVGLCRPPDPLHILDKMDALDRKRTLIDQCIEQAALVRREQRALLVAVDADHADGAAPGPHGQEQPLRAWQRLRSPPGDAIVLPGPVSPRQYRRRRACPRADSRLSPLSTGLPATG